MTVKLKSRSEVKGELDVLRFIFIHNRTMGLLERVASHIILKSKPDWTLCEPEVTIVCAYSTYIYIEPYIFGIKLS